MLGHRIALKLHLQSPFMSTSAHLYVPSTGHSGMVLMIILLSLAGSELDLWF